MTLVLPEPTGIPQETVPLPTMSLRVIPGVGSKAQPSTAGLINADWQLAGDSFGTGGVSVNVRGSREDPVEAPHVYDVVSGMFLHGAMTLDVADVRILKDRLKQQAERTDSSQQDEPDIVSKWMARGANSRFQRMANDAAAGTGASDSRPPRLCAAC